MAADEKPQKKEKGAGPEASAKAPPKEKAAKEGAAEAPKKAPEPPRPPADPRLKFLKKLRGRYLPKGPLRERHRELLARWNSGEDHGGVTVDELRTLVEDWKATRSAKTKARAGV
jgi:hypothetical protein